MYMKNIDFDNYKIILIILLLVGIIFMLLFCTKKDWSDNNEVSKKEDNTLVKERFVPINFEIELGNKLSDDIDSYVKVYDKKINKDDLIIDTSEIVVDQVGEYNYTVRYENEIRDGKIIVQDTTAPELKTKTLVINSGMTYTPADFVESCSDFSGCNYSFLNLKDQNYSSPGTYIIVVVATDAYQNSVNEKATLIVN